MSPRARLSGFAILFVTAAAYGSFVPLRWRPIGWLEGLRRAAEVPLEPVSLVFNGDFFTNVLVFLPIGFFTAGAIAEGRGSRPQGHDRRSGPVSFQSVLGVVFMGSALLSMLIELGQVFVRDRTPSWSDVYAQTLGGVAGAVFWWLVGIAILEWVAGALRASAPREDRILRLLGLYAAGWTVYSLLPTVFPQLAHPQLHLWTGRLNLSGLVLAGPLAIAALSSVPVGTFAALLSARPRWSATAGLVAGAGVALLVLADRVRQVSFMPAEGHLAAGLLGYSCGWLAVALGKRRMARWSPAMAQGIMLAGLAVWLGLIALLYWAPFDFGVSSVGLEQRLKVLYTRAPFHRYYWLPPLVALREVTTLLLLSLTTSLLAALVLRGRPPVVSTRTVVLGTMLFFALIEWGQLYLPARRADPTDVLIAGVGALMGTVILRALDGLPPWEGAVS